MGLERLTAEQVPDIAAYQRRVGVAHDLAVGAAYEGEPVAVDGVGGVVVVDGRIQPSQGASRAGEVGHGALQPKLAVLVHCDGHQLFGEGVGVDVPAGGEQEPVPPLHPHVLELDVAGLDAPALGVAVHVGHPLAALVGGQHRGPELIAVGVGAHPAVQVQAQAARVRVGDELVVLADDEHVPLAVHALGAVVVGEGGVQSLGLVAGDGVVNDVSGVLGWGGLGRYAGDGGPDDGLDLGAGQPRRGYGGGHGRRTVVGRALCFVGQAGDGGPDDGLDLGAGQARRGYGGGHGRRSVVGRARCFVGQAGHLRPHDLLHLGTGQPRVVAPAGGEQHRDKERESRCDNGASHLSPSIRRRPWCP